jgi:isopropylmalate/homocitrate/citramalate synthase
MFEILDTTLREGEQTPYVNFTMDEKIEIARPLDQVGVEMIEVGDPNVAPGVAKAVEKVASLGLRAEIVAHSIASRPSIERVQACGADRVAIFYATSKIHLDSKLHKTPEQAIEIICEHIAIKGSQAKCVIASSFVRIFFRNAINIGLPILECPEAVTDITEGDDIEVDLSTGEIFNRTKEHRYQARPLPAFVLKIAEAGGIGDCLKEHDIQELLC